MPRKCSVIGCRGNYAARKGEPADVNKVSAFHFPKDVSRKEQWLRRIPQELRSDDITDDMVVCEKHSESRNIASSLVPSVVASFKVLRDMRVEWFDDERQRDSSELAWLLGDDIKLSRWSQLPNICAYIQNSSSKKSAPTDILSRIQQLLKSLICSLKLCDDVDNKVTVLSFIYDQLSLLFAGQKRYFPRYLVVAFRLFCISRSAYQFLRDTCLTLPHISYLRQLSSCFTHSSTTLTDESAE